MSTRRSLLQILSSIVTLTMLFSGFSLPSAFAQGKNDGFKPQATAQIGKVNSVDPKNERQLFESMKTYLGGVQDSDPTPSPTKTPLSIEALHFVPTIDEPKLNKDTSNPIPSISEVTSLAGGTWYVATSGNDSNLCSSPNLPCATIKNAMNKAASGDLIKVAIGTYTSTFAYDSEVVVINKSVTLSGGWDAGFNNQTGYSTIDGKNSMRGIEISQNLIVEINRFTVKQGHTSYGGGMLIGNSTVNLDNMLIFNSTATEGGGIFAGGSLTINNSSVYGNQASFGGGISSQGNLIINNSAIFLNEAVSTSGGGSAGGIDADQATIRNTTIYSNTAVDGGGLSVGSGTLNNVTISKNDAQGNGGGISIGTGTLNNVTISENHAHGDGGGLYQPLLNGSAMSVSLKNSILANNTSDVEGMYGLNTNNCAVRGQLLYDGFSILYPANTCNYPGGNPVDPKLGTFIPTLGYSPLVAGSPAINTGNPATCTAADQRGIPRPNGACDLGAYEYTTPGPVTRLIMFEGDNQRTPPTFKFAKLLKVVAVDSQGSPVPGVNVTFTAPGSGASATFTSTNTPTASVLTDAGGTATSSILVANNQAGKYTISASVSGITPLSFNLENGAWYVSSSAAEGNTCSSANSPCATINEVMGKTAFMAGDLIYVAKGTYFGWGSEVLSININATLLGGWNETFTTRDGISIIDGQDTRRGIRVATGAVATLDHFMITHGYTRDASVMDGGGILNYGNLTLNFGSIHSNMAFGSGGGIRNEGILALNNTTVNNNFTSDFGGGIINITNASMTLNNTTVSNNGTTSYSSHGGGVYNLGTINLKNSIIANNVDKNQHPDCYGTGSFTSLGSNIIGNTSGCVINSIAGDKLNTDPKLGVFLPTQGYQSLQSTSPAINSGNSQTCYGSSDQRGVSRVGVCDIGAYEFTTPGSANSLLVLDGNDQRVPPTFTFLKILKLVALDNQGSPVPNVNVTFTALGNGASAFFTSNNANTYSILTNVSGVAGTSSLKANDQAGTYAISASANGVGSINFDLENGAWYVSPVGSDSNNCSSAASPCLTIDSAISNARKDDTILITLGTYDGSNGISVPQSLRIFGGWDNQFATQIGQSTIQGSFGVGNYPDYYQRTNVLLDHLTVSGRVNSAGVSNSGTLLFQNGSIINNNMGVYNQGVMTIINSTISGNGLVGIPSAYGGGISNQNPGDARIPRAAIKIINSTIANNQANSGAGIYNDSTAAGVVILQNSVVAGNIANAGYGNDCQGGNGLGTFTSLGYNIIGNIGTYNGAVFPCKGNWLATDKVGNGTSPIDPKLNPLVNLGNAVWIHSLQSESLALDSVLSNQCPATDQRGVVRPQGSHCEIGSYEVPYITGNVGVAGVTLSYTIGTPKTVTSQADGSYAFPVPDNWTGTVTPMHSCFTFNPVSRSYNNLVGGQTSQDFTPTLVSASGCADVNILIGTTSPARFGLPANASTRVSFIGVNNGPAKIVSTNSLPLIGAERVIYKVNNVNTSFTEMMGLPHSQLDKIYWLPWYNNVDLDTQLRFGNVSGSTAHVHVYIGKDEMTGSPFTLQPGESIRQSFAGINNGPVKIQSDQNIVAAERVIYKVNGTQTSFSEMMGLPDSQLNTTYWLPWYNNVDLDTQLRFGNVSNNIAHVHVYIGKDEMTGSPFTLRPGESTRQSFAGINNGPVKIESDQNVVAAERVIYKVNGTNTSFIETMGLPDSQLTTTYWLPWYNNIDLDTQLRIGNVSNNTATVHIFIGGTEVTPVSGITLPTGASTRVSYTGVNNGPVRIVSDQNVVAAERVIYKVKNVNTSFSEMMALPDSQLNATYWLPWYNNVDLDTQLRFGVP